MKIFTWSLSTPFYGMYFFVLTISDKYYYPPKEKKVLYVIMITASRD